MPAAQGLDLHGPYGGFGGGYYNELYEEHKIKNIDAWGRSFRGYDVLNGFQFTWDDGLQGHLIGHKNDNIYEGFAFKDVEKMNSMIFYAGDGEGFVNGFEFDTNHGRHYSIGGKEGNLNHLNHLGTGDMIGAEGRDSIHDSGEDLLQDLRACGLYTVIISATHCYEMPWCWFFPRCTLFSPRSYANAKTT